MLRRHRGKVPIPIITRFNYHQSHWLFPAVAVAVAVDAIIITLSSNLSLTYDATTTIHLLHFASGTIFTFDFAAVYCIAAEQVDFDFVLKFEFVRGTGNCE
ncbi:hypothetical protein QVD17_05417 [Tagetes erecta]|uniref:Uncharacterized protein n=1 Tax=Tagetes erecta TaxID=13708 RepID=A0AAD8LDS5_TARER|nr:hypothetical protein QVD17_05417 [Tagetes erecta]